MVEQFHIDEAVQDLITVDDFIRWAVTQFNQSEVYFGHGTDNSWDEAVVLVMFALSLPLERSHQIGQTRLTRFERAKVAELIRQRIEQRVPAAYLTNEGWFNGQPFYVDERVLVPRSPIAELIQAEFQPWLSQAPQRVLDLCTGSGCIGIECARAFPGAMVDVADICLDALAVADINIQEHGMAAVSYTHLTLPTKA